MATGSGVAVAGTTTLVDSGHAPSPLVTVGVWSAAVGVAASVDTSVGAGIPSSGPGPMAGVTVSTSVCIVSTVNGVSVANGASAPLAPSPGLCSSRSCSPDSWRGICTVISGSGVGGKVGLGPTGTTVAGTEMSVAVGEGSRTGTVALGCKSDVGVTVGVTVADAIGIMVDAGIGVEIGGEIGVIAVAVTATAVASSSGVSVANAAAPDAIKRRRVMTAVCDAPSWRSAHIVSSC